MLTLVLLSQTHGYIYICLNIYCRKFIYIIEWKNHFKIDSDYRSYDSCLCLRKQIEKTFVNLLMITFLIALIRKHIICDDFSKKIAAKLFKLAAK